jgi:hypothetical protein
MGALVYPDFGLLIQILYTGILVIDACSLQPTALSDPTFRQCWECVASLFVNQKFPIRLDTT